jgi:hypothetical protein
MFVPSLSWYNTDRFEYGSKNWRQKLGGGFPYIYILYRIYIYIRSNWHTSVLHVISGVAVLRQQACHSLPLLLLLARKRYSFLSVFSVFVPSLSWQNDHLSIKSDKKCRFLTSLLCSITLQPTRTHIIQLDQLQIKNASPKRGVQM